MAIQRWHAIAASLAILLMLSALPMLQNAQIATLEFFGGKAVPAPGIAIVAIDNMSLQEIGRWPWNRSTQARLISTLNSENPRAIGLDVSYSEPQDAENDAALARSIAESRAPVVLAAQALYYKNPESVELKKPLNAFLAPNASYGHVNAPTGIDGVARLLPGIIQTGHEPEMVKPFSWKLAESIRLDHPTFQQPKPGLKSRFLDSQTLISFSGNAGTFPTYSAADLLAGNMQKGALEDTIVLIGATASELHDTVQLPGSGQLMSGVEWNATVLSNLLMQNSRTLLPEWYALAIGLAALLFYSYLATSGRQKYSTIFAVGSFVAFPTASYIAWQSNVGIPYFINMMAIAMAFFGQSIIRWILAEREKRRIKENLQFYFSPQILQLVMEHPEQLRLGGDRREVTVFFSDIRSFTTITESIDPATLSTMLYEYFSEMSEEIFATDGVLDKFIGDAIMAFWGAPIEQKDQADRAVTAALNMLSRLKRLQEKWQNEGLPFIDIGIGIHTGIATVGNMGSQKRFDYTVIGDCVNAASRLEGLNKQFGTRIIVSEETKDKLTIPVRTRFLDDIQVKGKTKPLRVYEIQG